MAPHTMSPTSNQPRRKRQRRDSQDDLHADEASSSRSRDSHNDLHDRDIAKAISGESTIFRNISACSRCRLRKNRCDQRLPSCAGCAKAGVACVGYDILTKREIPRSYLFYLENRVEQLEKILISHNISFPAATDLESCALTGAASAKAALDGDDDDAVVPASKPSPSFKHMHSGYNPSISTSVQHASSGSLAYREGSAFTIKTFHAMQYPAANSDDDEQIRNQLSALPERHLAFQLVMAYFDKVNPQFPILYRGDFMKVFNRVYAKKFGDANFQDFYFFYMVLAIGAGHAFTPGDEVETSGTGADESIDAAASKSLKQPEDYYRRAALCFEKSISADNNSLKVLQALLLFSSFALLRSVSPGIWYITGVALRYAVDMGLHQEITESSKSDQEDNEEDEAKRKKQKYKRELKRRLWWCTYSLDRLVSISLARPFGISDNDITTPMPSAKENNFFEKEALMKFSNGQTKRNCDPISQHFIRLRILQSEILAASQQARAPGSSVESRVSPEFNRSAASTPDSGSQQLQHTPEWTQAMEKRLDEWQAMAPTIPATGVSFPKAIFEFYYMQTLIVIYQSPLNTKLLVEDISSLAKQLESSSSTPKPLQDHEHAAYLKVAQAGQKVLRTYRQRHLTGCIQYTFSSTHYLFRVAMLYLHAIGKSSVVRSKISVDDIDFTVLAASSIFSDMKSNCPSAKDWIQTMERTAKIVARIKSLSADGESSTSFAMLQDESPSSDKDNFTDFLMHEKEAENAGMFPWDMSGEASSMDMELSPPSQTRPTPSVPILARNRAEKRQQSSDSVDTRKLWNIDDLVNEPPEMGQGLETSLLELRDLQNWLMLPPDSPDVRIGARTDPSVFRP